MIIRLWKQLFLLKALLGFVVVVVADILDIFGDPAPFSDRNYDVWKTIRSFGLDLVRTLSLLEDQRCSSSVLGSCSNWAWNVLSDLEKIDKYRLVQPKTTEKLKSESKKGPTFKNWPLIKNPHFLTYPHETL